MTGTRSCPCPDLNCSEQKVQFEQLGFFEKHRYFLSGNSSLDLFLNSPLAPLQDTAGVFAIEGVTSVL